MDDASNIANVEAQPTTRSSGDRTLLPAVRSEFDERPLAVADDLPSYPSISEAEIDAIERYMADILDEVLSPSARGN